VTHLLAEAMIRFDELYARAMEFWRGIENRRHERTLHWDDEGRWRKVLLYP